jgi:protein-L-isoaspartate(D-aspartate) O-methyltransferase
MNAMNLPEVEIARFNMIEQQIKPWDVSDTHVIDALFALHRERFTPPSMRALAFSDFEVPLVLSTGDTNQTMLSPKIEARFAQALDLSHDDCVLEIGTGSGFQAALLAQIARQITTVEIDPKLVAFAQENLRQNHINQVTVETGDGCKGWGSNEYDAILLTGSLPSVPDSLKYQLRIGGRLVVVVGQAPVMTAIKITRTTAASFETQSLFETVIKPLVGPHVSQFKF